MLNDVGFKIDLFCCRYFYKGRNKMRKGIAIAGNLIVDFVKEIDVYPKSGMLTNIGKVQQSVGGCVPNTLINLAKMDNELELFAFGMAGSDSNGKYIKDVLKKHGIDTGGIKENPNTLTSFTDVMTVSKDKTRTFFHARGANAVFDIENINFEGITAQLFHIGYALLLDRFDTLDEEYGTVMAKALCLAKQQGMKTSMDVVSENSNRFAKVVTPNLKYCDYLIINEVEASMICGMPVRKDTNLDKEYLKAVCSELIGKGVGEWVVVHAPEASCAMNKDGEFAFVPSLLLPDGYIKGTVGAGDAFCAGMLYSLYHDYDIEYALEIGAGAAACNLSEFNSIDGMKSIAGIKEMIERYSR